MLHDNWLFMIAFHLLSIYFFFPKWEIQTIYIFLFYFILIQGQLIKKYVFIDKTVKYPLRAIILLQICLYLYN